MSINHYRKLCERHRGRAVEIRTHDGRVHRGIIESVNNRSVFLKPIDQRRSLGGFGYGPWGFGGYGSGGVGFGIALGAIATLILLPFFFW